MNQLKGGDIERLSPTTGLLSIPRHNQEKEEDYDYQKNNMGSISLDDAAFDGVISLPSSTHCRPYDTGAPCA
jgi:hypothetical protein